VSGGQPSGAPGHGAALTIDLRALQDNWHLMQARATASNPQAQAGAVVKADAYGIGIEAAVPALWRAGCREFFVAHLSEARRARAVAPEAAIYVLNGLPEGGGPACLADRLIPVLGSRAEAEEWRVAGAGAPCAIHVDTGMNRLGFDAGEALANRAFFEALNVVVVMTHLSSSEVPEDPANAAQIATFAAIAAAFPGARKSLLNSSGHFLKGAPAHDLTRPGYGLYGGNPTPGAANPMRPVLRLEAPIIQIRPVPAGAQAGYNHTWTAQRDSRLVTISCGYADGYPRNASARDGLPGGEALIGDVVCPIVGTVSMDLIIVDATDAPESACRRGAMVTLIGGPLDLDRVGASARTIGYEILTNLGRRYQRHYIGS
jgi:alanine racemase